MDRSDAMKKYVLCAILVVAVVIAAGCTGRQIKQEPTRGVTINSFETSDLEVLSKDPVLFDLEIENIGGTTASNVVVDLLGIEGKWRDTFSTLVHDTQSKELPDLKPPMPSRNIPGDFQLKQWQLIAPETPQGISPTYPVTARVSYDYNTSGYFRIAAISEGEYRRMQALQQTTEFTPEVTNSQGPIHLNIPEKYMQFIRVDTESGTNYEERSFRFNFQNVGDGFPITPDNEGNVIGMGGRVRGTIEVRGPGVSFSNCLGQTSGTVIDLDNSEITPQLRSKGVFPVSCSIQIDKSVWGDRPKDTVEFVFNIFYRYYVDSTLTIKVVGE